MLSLIKIEWLKIKRYPAFWWMLGIVALTYPGVNTMFYYIYLDIANGKDIRFVPIARISLMAGAENSLSAVSYLMY
jgi:hypothetical protein